ncbi:unnamed protein product [Ixodes hexagonus]
MRVTPWIAQYLRSRKPGGDGTAPLEYGVALVKSVLPTHAVIGDGQTEIPAVFSEDVRELVRLTLGGGLSALEKRHVRVLTAEPCFVLVRGRRREAIMVDQVVVLEQGGQAEAALAEATATGEQPDNITFKSDARNLIKKAVTKLATPEKRANRVDALLRDMKSRMGAALTTPTTAHSLKTEPPSDAPHNGTEDAPMRASVVGAPTNPVADGGQEAQSTSATKKGPGSPENSPGKRLRSTARASRVSLRSGKCYGNGETETKSSDALPPSPKRSRTSVPTSQKEVEPTPAASTSASPSARPAKTPAKQTRPRGQARAACQRPPLWDIAPPLLEAMRNLVHKHFSKWT